jgi:hypothetical protein
MTTGCQFLAGTISTYVSASYGLLSIHNSPAKLKTDPSETTVKALKVSSHWSQAVYYGTRGNGMQNREAAHKAMAEKREEAKAAAAAKTAAPNPAPPPMPTPLPGQAAPGSQQTSGAPFPLKREHTRNAEQYV